MIRKVPGTKALQCGNTLIHQTFLGDAELAVNYDQSQP